MQYSEDTKDTIINIETDHILHTYSKRQIVITHGKDAVLFDHQGNEYIDCVGAWGAANLGHANQVITDAIKEQADRLISCPSIFYNDTRARALEKLLEVSPKELSRVFFTNSGTESVEAALKFAIYTTQKTHVISTMKAFHGRTLGALSVTYKKNYRTNFIRGTLENDVTFVPLNNLEKLRSAVRDDTAAIILEVIQGEGGINIADKQYIQSVREFCTENEIILIIDEVQTGFCRTGRMFAFQHYDIIPDILCLAKSIAGGVPMGAILVTDKIKTQIGIHGSTFGGNPLSSAALIAAIQYMQDQELASCAEKLGNYFLTQLNDKLAESKIVRNIRGIGLMIGIELKKRVHPYLEELLENRILASAVGKTVIRLLPPLVITEEQIDTVVNILAGVLTD